MPSVKELGVVVGAKAVEDAVVLLLDAPAPLWALELEAELKGFGEHHGILCRQGRVAEERDQIHGVVGVWLRLAESPCPVKKSYTRPPMFKKRGI